jgi:hypothetical protein
MRARPRIRASVLDQAVPHPITLKHLAEASSAQLVEVLQDLLGAK